VLAPLSTIAHHGYWCVFFGIVLPTDSSAIGSCRERSPQVYHVHAYASLPRLISSLANGYAASELYYGVSVLLNVFAFDSFADKSPLCICLPHSFIFALLLVHCLIFLPQKKGEKVRCLICALAVVYVSGLKFRCAQVKRYTNIWAWGPNVMHMMIDKTIMSCLLRWLECWNWLTYFLEIIVFCTGGVLLDCFIIVFVNHKLRVSFCMVHIDIYACFICE
jgi:hypothetical protein